MYFDEKNNYFDIADYNSYNYDGPYNLVNIGNIVFNRNNTNDDILMNFNKGTIFNNLYDKYKEHYYSIKVSSEKDKLLYKIQAYYFAVKDLSLYLDLHPKDKERISLLNKYNEELNKLIDEYNSKYSPLELSGFIDNEYFNYIDNPWPWDKGEHYV